MPKANISALAALSLSFEESKIKINPNRSLRHQNFTGDGSSSHTSESSDTVFPELQQLPKEAKLPIRDFIRGQISRIEAGKEIPRRLWLLAEATKNLDDDGEEIGDPGIKSAGGPYGTILHTASTIGNDWLVSLQIQAGVDVSAFDKHLWTALMVAKAQGHTSCANLLARHMANREAKALPEVLSPSGLIIAGSKMSFSKSSLILKAGTQFRSDHPIPSHCRTFYYEIRIQASNVFSGWVHAITLIFKTFYRLITTS